MSTILTGPWFQCEADPGGYTPKTLVASIGGGIEIHAHHDVGTEDRIAIAAAIAALPDMLEALVMIRDADDDCRRDGLPTIPLIARGSIVATIARATGGAS